MQYELRRSTAFKVLFFLPLVFALFFLLRSMQHEPASADGGRGSSSQPVQSTPTIVRTQTSAISNTPPPAGADPVEPPTSVAPPIVIPPARRVGVGTNAQSINEITLTKSVSRSEINFDDSSDNREVVFTLNVENNVNCSPPPPAEVMLAIDTSGSMNQDVNGYWGESSSFVPPTKMTTAKDAATTLVDSLNEQSDLVGMSQFKDPANLVIGLTSNYAQVRQSITSLDETDWQNDNMGQALQIAFQQLQASQQTGSRQFIVLMGDGGATGADPVPIANQIKASGIEIYGIAFGSRANISLIESVASPGRFYNASDGQQLIAAFAQIGTEISSGGEDTIINDSLLGIGSTVTLGSIDPEPSMLGTGPLSWNLGNIDCDTAQIQYTVTLDDSYDPDVDLINSAQVQYGSATGGSQTVSIQVLEEENIIEEIIPGSFPIELPETGSTAFIIGVPLLIALVGGPVVYFMFLRKKPEIPVQSGEGITEGSGNGNQ